mgnify:CR=1 FL=1
MVRRDKTDTINFRVTPEEKKTIYQNAAAVGLSVSALLIGLAAGDKAGEFIAKLIGKDKK